MKFLNASRTLVLAWIVAVSLLFLVLPGSSKRYDPDPRDPWHTCVYACMPGGSHGCRDKCPVCDPVLRRCVAEGGGEGGSTTLRVTIAPPPPPPATSKPPPPPPPTGAPPPGTTAPSGGTTTAPPSGTKCTGIITNTSGSTTMWERTSFQSRNVGATPRWATIELTEKVIGDTIIGNPRWFKYSGAWISGRFLLLNKGGSAWCTN